MSEECPECGKPYLDKSILCHPDPADDRYLEIYIHERDGLIVTESCNKLVQ